MQHDAGVLDMHAERAHHGSTCRQDICSRRLVDALVGPFCDSRDTVTALLHVPASWLLLLSCGPAGRPADHV